MEAVIVNFRKGRHTVHHYQMVLKVHGIDTKENAEKIVGKTVIWSSPAGKRITGKVTSVHGNSGAVRARFDTGMPGQAIGAKVVVE